MAGGRQWWRAYAEARRDPKLLSLSRSDRWYWFEVLCLACEQEACITSASLLQTVCKGRADHVARVLQMLCSAGLLDKTGDDNYTPHNWKGRQFRSDSSTERTRKYRNGKRHSDGGGDGPEQSRTEHIEETARAVSRSNGKSAGSRLPADWQPSSADLDYAEAHGLQDHALGEEIERFRNYWTAKSGANARKRDWAATWRNWVLSPLRKPQKSDWRKVIV